MEVLLSFLTSSTAKWISILLLTMFAGGYIYYASSQFAELKKQAALYEYNIKELNNVIKQNQDYIRHMEEISKAKSDIINQLYRDADKLEEQSKEIEVEIEKEVVKGNDRPASNILKETFRKLSGK